MRLTTALLVLAGVIALAFTYTSTAQIQPRVKMNIEKVGENDGPGNIIVTGILDNQDGTSTISLLACGYAVDVTAKNEDFRNSKALLEVEVNAKLAELCGL